LGTLRYRLDPRLKAQGIDLDWQIQDLPRIGSLSPQNLLHILRILQEAFTNVLKHARASVVRVATGIDASGRNVLITLQDNGAGFSGDRTGHGLHNMRDRAR